MRVQRESSRYRINSTPSARTGPSPENLSPLITSRTFSPPFANSIILLANVHSYVMSLKRYKVFWQTFFASTAAVVDDGSRQFSLIFLINILGEGSVSPLAGGLIMFQPTLSPKKGSRKSNLVG